jgi:tetratricopeptide (TPR) repeat protein
MMKKADSLYFTRNWEQAKAIYIKLLGDTSHNNIAWNRLGFSNYNTGNYDAAMKCYQKALENKPIVPVRASAYSRMARINALQNKPEQAYTNIDSALASGYSAFPELDTLKDFDNVRGSEKFKQLRTAVYNFAFPCMANAHAREFDFWAGEWNVFVTGTNTVAGHSVIQVIAGGCAILENWTSNNGFNNGKSINFIDPVTNKWKQSWAGAYANGIQEFTNGEYKDGAMRFTFETTTPQNQKLIGRFIFFNQGIGKVRQFNETSADNGKTWTTSYDFTYIRIGDSKADL